jgi:amino acid adenylation domain-containing protein
VRVQLKRGGYCNELNRFRYDVTLGCDRPAVTVPEVPTDWQKAGFTLDTFRQWLQTKQPESVRLVNIANARLQSVLSAIAPLRPEAAAALEETQAIEPEDFWALEHQLPYRFVVTWSATGDAGTFDVYGWHKGLSKEAKIFPSGGSVPLGPWSVYANHPERHNADLVPLVRGFLQEKLPNYMVPSGFTVLETLPLTPNGKVDRNALLALEAITNPESDALVPPRDRWESALVEIWSAILNLSPLGIRDNFFEIGGNSLSAVRVIARIKQDLGQVLPLATLFEHPTIEALARVSSELVDNTRPPIVPISRESDPGEVVFFPASFAQENLWLLEQLQGGGAYTMLAAARVVGDFNLAALEKALAEIVARHEVTRSTFHLRNGELVQVIHPKGTVKLSCENLPNVSIEDRELEIEKLLQNERVTPFDLARGPLLRVKVWPVETDVHIVSVAMHHIISDGWSYDILLRELSRLYRAFLDGEPSPLPALAIQYADFSCRQREYLTGEVLNRQIDYWRERLKGSPPRIELPTDRPDTLERDRRGHRIKQILSPRLTKDLQNFATGRKTTLFAVLLTALKILLFRWTGQDDLTVGTVTAGRDDPALESLIGCFINFLALRSRLSGEETAGRFLQRESESLLSAYAHQNCPFEKVVEAIAPPRENFRTPFYNVALLLQNFPAELAFDSSVQTFPIASENPSALLDLRLVAIETPDGLQIDYEYDSGLFDSDTIKRMSGHFQILLEGILSELECPISELPLLTERERHQILVEWNDTAVDYPLDKCLHHLVEEQVEQTPNAVAVVFESESLTYRELNARADRLARYLQKRGVGVETPVGICLERSLEMVVGLLAILKAGAAYVPLDPDYPPERLSFLLEDAGVPLLVTSEKLLDRLPPIAGEILCLDQEREIIDHEGDSPLNPGVGPDNLAYIIYTSGSTGKPKGAMNTHRGIVNRLCWMQETYGLTPDERVLQKTPFSFDVSVWEFFWPLLAGATLVVAKPSGHRDSSYLVETIAKWGITTLHFVPSMLQVFLEEKRLERCNSLKRVFCSGEALPHSLQDRFFERFNCELHNLYGPTEAAVDVTYHACQRNDPRASVPIGCPVANTHLYILDRQGQPVPVGVSGELHIGGVQVARGYLNRPELTAEKFIPDPFSDDPKARLYKTGDLARYLPDGNIEYIGRTDHQVKLRGFRIETGEIEAVLNQHPSIREVTIIAREDNHGDKCLVAYFVPSTEELNARQIRDFLKASLPNYMIPSAFVPLEYLPLTPNGKIDRKALPFPDGLGLATGEEYIAPRTESERRLAAIWTELLGREVIGINENFFEIGGHSLSAVRLLDRIGVSFGKNLSPVDFFQNPTIRKLASYLRREEVSAWSALVPLQALGSKPPLFCIHPAGGNVLCYQDFARTLGKERPFYGLQSFGLSGTLPPHETIEAMAIAYLREIRSVQERGPYHLAGWSLGGLVAYEIARQMERVQEKVAFVGLLDTYILSELPLEEPNWLELGRSVFGPRFSLAPDEPKGDSEEEKALAVFERAHALELLSEGLDFERMRLLWKVYRVNLEAGYRYYPGSYSGQVVLYTAREGLSITLTDPSEPWKSRLGKNLQIERVSGHHRNLVDPPHIFDLVARIESNLGAG